MAGTVGGNGEGNGGMTRAQIRALYVLLEELYVMAADQHPQVWRRLEAFRQTLLTSEAGREALQGCRRIEPPG